jgi:hypothetical protein
MKDEPLQKLEENASVQIKEAKIQKIMKRKWKKIEKITCTKIILETK